MNINRRLIVIITAIHLLVFGAILGLVIGAKAISRSPSVETAAPGAQAIIIEDGVYKNPLEFYSQDTPEQLFGKTYKTFGAGTGLFTLGLVCSDEAPAAKQMYIDPNADSETLKLVILGLQARLALTISEEALESIRQKIKSAEEVPEMVTMHLAMAEEHYESAKSDADKLAEAAEAESPDADTITKLATKIIGKCSKVYALCKSVGKMLDDPDAAKGMGKIPI